MRSTCPALDNRLPFPYHARIPPMKFSPLGSSPPPWPPAVTAPPLAQRSHQHLDLVHAGPQGRAGPFPRSRSRPQGGRPHQEHRRPSGAPGTAISAATFKDPAIAFSIERPFNGSTVVVKYSGQVECDTFKCDRSTPVLANLEPPIDWIAEVTKLDLTPWHQFKLMGIELRREAGPACLRGPDSILMKLIPSLLPLEPDFRFRGPRGRRPGGGGSPAVLATMEKAADWQLGHPAKEKMDGWVQGAVLHGAVGPGRARARRPVPCGAPLKIGAGNEWQPAATRYSDLQRRRPVRRPDVPRDVPAGPGPADARAGAGAMRLYPGPPTGRQPGIFARRKAKKDTSGPGATRFSWRRPSGFAWRRPPGTGPTATMRWRSGGRARSFSTIRRSIFISGTAPIFPEAGEKRAEGLFWSRGNGWVLAGLARVLDYLPGGRSGPSAFRTAVPARSPAACANELQQPDGFWRTSSARSGHAFRSRKRAARAFLCFGIAWG